MSARAGRVWLRDRRIATTELPAMFAMERCRDGGVAREGTTRQSGIGRWMHEVDADDLNAR